MGANDTYLAVFTSNKTEVDAMTGHSQEGLEAELEAKTSFADFFGRAPHLNPSRQL